jgi:CRP/FNR family cyclic AMP-dependent transcriptional regulator
MEEAVKQLNDIPAINRFLSYCRVRTVPSKTALIHAGDLPDVLYYIIRGSVEVMIEDEDGNEMVLAYLNKGQFFGEMGLFSDSQQRSAWVRTRTQCELAEMTYPRFRQVASESPGLVFELATQLATRLDRTNRKLGDLAFVDVTGRIAHAIMDLCGEPDAMTHPQGMQIKVSRQELSRLVGCSRDPRSRPAPPPSTRRPPPPPRNKEGTEPYFHRRIAAARFSLEIGLRPLFISRRSLRASRGWSPRSP